SAPRLGFDRYSWISACGERRSEDGGAANGGNAQIAVIADRLFEQLSRVTRCPDRRPSEPINEEFLYAMSMACTQGRARFGAETQTGQGPSAAENKDVADPSTRPITPWSEKG